VKACADSFLSPGRGNPRQPFPTPASRSRLRRDSPTNKHRRHPLLLRVHHGRAGCGGQEVSSGDVPQSTAWCWSNRPLTHVPHTRGRLSPRSHQESFLETLGANSRETRLASESAAPVKHRAIPPRPLVRRRHNTDSSRYHTTPGDLAGPQPQHEPDLSTGRVAEDRCCPHSL